MSRQKDPLHSDIITIMNFMYELYESGKTYSLMNTTRSALSSFVLLEDGLNVGTHPLLCRFFKGIFNLRPPLPRYTHIWDARIILNHLRSLSPIKYLSLKNLTLKLCMLLALLSAQRCQSIHKLRICDIFGVIIFGCSLMQPLSTGG